MPPRRRRLFAPETVQSSGMDCGPAALKSFLAGFGISLSYDRLREACQTEVDGTSIETLEELLNGLGVPVEQVLLPKDVLLLDESRAFPAIAVFRLPNGNTHFAVIWSLTAGIAQVMDPANGRRWLSRKALLEELYEHVMTVPAVDWRAWASSEEGLALFRRRLLHHGVSAETSGDWLSERSFESLAALDAALRYSPKGSGALRTVFEGACSDRSAIPREFWSVRPDGDGDAVIRGAVVLRLRKDGGSPTEARLPAAVATARDEKPILPSRELWQWLRKDGVFSPAALLAATMVSAAAIVFEAVFFRFLLATSALRGLFVVFLLFVLALEYSILTSELRLGRRFELALRRAFQRKIPRLSDRFFSSRLTSDMAERHHRLHVLRKLPRLGRQLLREGVELLLTAGAILWLAPSAAFLVLAALAASVAIPLLGQPILFERDSRVRSHVGGLSRFYLDSLLGLVPLRVHRAERALRSEHEGLLLSWARARRGLQSTVVGLETLQFAFGYGLTALLVFSYLGSGGDPASVLLLAYWALNLPVLGLAIVRLLSRYPEPRNTFLRVAEPLRAPEERDLAPAESVSAETSPTRGAAIRLEKVSVRVAGHLLLEDVDLALSPGSHVAVVGASGAGKTTLFGVLLGFHFPENGRVLVDGSILSGSRLPEVRARTAWVDPAVQIWNRSLEENLRYGNESLEDLPLALSVLGSLPGKYGTKLGEGGALVSGGEGQRVRLGRALLRKDVRLALLDEPFRGLDRKSRAELLRITRAHFQNATLLTITHDVSEAEEFDRVLVLEKGRLVEDGRPRKLFLREDSRYRRLLEAERELSRLWSDGIWRPWLIEKGELRRGL